MSIRVHPHSCKVCLLNCMSGFVDEHGEFLVETLAVSKDRWGPLSICSCTLLLAHRNVRKDSRALKEKGWHVQVATGKHIP